MKDVTGKKIEAGQVIIVHWDNSEDEAGDGVGNASMSSGYYECDVKIKGKGLIFVSDFQHDIVRIYN